MQAASGYATARHEYRLRTVAGPVFRVWFWLFPLVFLLIIVTDFVRHNSLGATIFIGPWLLWTSSWLVLQKTRLALTSQWIEYCLPGGVLRAAWPDVVRFGSGPRWQQWGSRGLLLRQWQWELSGRMHWQGQRVGGYIPVTTFMGPYWERGLTEDLRRYAPWLWEPAASQGGEMPPTSAEVERHGRTRYWLIGGVTVAGTIIISLVSVLLNLSSSLMATLTVGLVVLVIGGALFAARERR